MKHFAAKKHSSDLLASLLLFGLYVLLLLLLLLFAARAYRNAVQGTDEKIGRASCRERVCLYV